ncbi:MAG: molecular chaperone HtpG, partial [archaeon]|nr:molecular chaperone HtpG [archaeon]
EDEKKEAEKKDEELKSVTDFVKETLGDKVAVVRISHKLKNHAVFLTTQGGITFEVEKYYKDMPGGGMGLKAERVLELNDEAPVFKSLQTAIEADKDKAAKIAKVMYGQACIMAGQPIDDPVEYADMVLEMI